MATKQGSNQSWSEAIVQRLVDPNDIFKDNSENMVETVSFQGLLPNWCRTPSKLKKLSPRSGTRSPRIMKKQLNIQTEESTKLAHDPSHQVPLKDPILLRTARDYLQRLAFSSYLSHKKTPQHKCSTCDGIETPSYLLPLENHNEWNLPFDIISTNSNKSSRRKSGCEERLSRFTSSDIASVASLLDTDSGNLNKLLNARALQASSNQCRRSSNSSRVRKECQESLMQHAFVDDLSEFVCFPFTQTKQMNNVLKITDNLEKLSLNISQNVSPKPSLSPFHSFQTQSTHLSPIPTKPAFRPKLSNTGTPKRHQSKTAAPVKEEADMSVQNTLDFFMNMTSPLKTDDILNASISASTKFVARSLTRELSESFLDCSLMQSHDEEFGNFRS